MRFIGEDGSFERHFFHYEKDFEKQLYRFRNDLFRGGHFVRWEPLLKDTLVPEGVQPDSLLVSLDNDEWWVVEVELGKRSKLPLMVDQLGKLSRVNYNNYSKDIMSGLVKIGFSKSKAENTAKRLSLERPNFLLILDQTQKEMIQAAKSFNFETLIVRCYSNNSGQYRLTVENELGLTKEPISEGKEELSIYVKDGHRPIEANGNWFYEIPNSIFAPDIYQILIESRKENFTCPISRVNDKVFLILPLARKPIYEMFKGNKVGKLFLSEGGFSYRLKEDWPK